MSLKKSKINKIEPRVLYMKNGKIALEFSYDEYRVLKDKLYRLYVDCYDNDELLLRGKKGYNLFKNYENDIERNMFEDSKKELRDSVLLKGIDDSTPFTFGSVDNEISMFTPTKRSQSALRTMRKYDDKGLDYKYSDFISESTLPKDFAVFKKQYLKKHPEATHNDVFNAYKKRAKFNK